MRKTGLLVFIFCCSVLFILSSWVTVVMGEDFSLDNDIMLKSIPDFPQKNEKILNQYYFLGSVSDLVMIDNNGYEILTPDGLQIKYKPANDSIYVLTQDLLHQFHLYQNFYKDPLSTAISFVYNDIHLNVYDMKNGIDLFLTCNETEWASVFPDAVQWSEKDKELLISFFQQNGFEQAKSTAFMAIGGNYWLVFDCSDTDGLVYLFSAVFGRQIRVTFNALNNDDIQKGLLLITQLTIDKYQ